MQGYEPFIELVEVEKATGDRKHLYDDLERVRGKGRVSNLFKAYGAFPELGIANFKRLTVLLSRGTLSEKLKESVMTALAVINHCDYCVSFHGSQLQSLGSSDTEIAAAREFNPEDIDFSPKERALFEYAMKANGDAHSITPEDIKVCRDLGTTDAEFVEILETVNTGNAFNTFAGALNIGADNFLSYAMDEYREKKAAANS
ncbi:MAG: hypothetical protein CFH41_00938 [Alphaproteobacteria bacterium MarineAlpha11_Bin1]|nr:MAG: hypothetical protein CFH41_00938 [Alphaproteobacteria bacterium MarineAlpha11_Bin1]|tara:strand:+ start:44942 stop:45547 length:606 start_codon:yes stop_codon:yes gene_type:complete